MVVPEPADFLSVPALTNDGAGAVPSLSPKSLRKSHVPLLWIMAPTPIVTVFVLVQMVSARVRVRWLIVLTLGLLMVRIPSTLMAPVPERVPPDHPAAPVMVTASDPERVPLDMVSVGMLIGSPLLRLS